MARPTGTVLLSLALARLTLAGAAHASLGATATATLDSATVVGTTNGSVTSYFGIPYAAPPVGDLRLRLPQAAGPYDGTISATQVAAQCLQIPQLPPPDLPAGILQDLAAYSAMLGKPTGAPESEDCLTVSVQVPAGTKPGDKLPVLAFIYGGGFATGSTAQNPGDVVVQRSIEMGESIVYVNMNYRIGAFGFLGGKEVKEAGVGNLGLHDQRLALRWVQKYISAFGGDPDKVTIWGVSAGAISVSLHMLTNGGDNEGLFRGAVMHSGSPLPTGDIELLQPAYDAVVANTSCAGSDDTLDCLRQLPAEELSGAAATLPTLFDFQGLREPWAPHADGVFLEAPLHQLVLNGSVAPVPFLTGDCLDEGTAFATGAFNVSTDADFQAYIQDVWFPGTPSSVLSTLFEAYPDDPAAGSPFGTGDANQLYPQYKRVAAFSGDMAFQAPRRFFLDQRSSQQPAWSFSSERITILELGAAHGSDFAAVLQQGDDLADYVIHFANTLNPNGASNRTIDWPQYDPANRQILRLLDGETPLEVGQDTARADALAAVTSLSLDYPI
ncbi:alpha/beta-hydrolase [Trametes elegans]|nr:alpha/beta-hydrolase [Trametes elegans]